MPIQNDINLLDPRMQKCIRRLIELVPARMQGYQLYVNETLRQLSVQMAYRARGTAPAWLVKEYFKACGLWQITDAECAVQNTKTMESKHLQGLAADVYLIRGKKILWTAAPEEWAKLFAIAEDECGLDACAGGKFNAWKWDMPHMEFRAEI